MLWIISPTVTTRHSESWFVSCAASYIQRPEASGLRLVIHTELAVVAENQHLIRPEFRQDSA